MPAHIGGAEMNASRRRRDLSEIPASVAMIRW
jgi:hypothetical protein